MKKLSRASLLARAAKIKMIAMDVDGVLTAGDVIVLESGEEIKFWNSKDRLMMALLRGLQEKPILAWITGRSSKAVKHAAEDLGIPHVVQGCKDKKKALSDLLKEYKLSFDQAAYIGDDLIDLAVMCSVGLSVCPSDAVEEIKEESHYISPYAGGKGVARDVIRLILQAQKKWNPLIASLRE